MNGEKGNWRGQLFDQSAARLTKLLGYKEDFSGKFRVDLVATPPQSFPVSSANRPLFSPDGQTAFEFTCEGDVSEALVDELHGKVQLIITEQKLPLAGGILGCDLRVADRLIQYGEGKGVFIWDVRDFNFLSQKVHDLKVSETFSNERFVSQYVTMLWKFIRMTRGFSKAKVAILFHHPLHEISLPELREAMTKVDPLVTSILNEAGLLPSQVETEIRCRGYHSKDLTNAQAVLDEFIKADELIYSLTKVDCYYQAPWSGMIPRD